MANLIMEYPCSILIFLMILGIRAILIKIIFYSSECSIKASVTVHSIYCAVSG